MKTTFTTLALFAALIGTSLAEEKSMPQAKADGYRGIWFTLGQYFGKGTDGKPYGPRTRKPTFPYGDKYSGGLGTYTAKHVPLAVYSEKANKTFFVYGGARKDRQRYLLCMAGTFDHRTGTVTRPTIVHDKGGVDDPHDNPSIALDADGYVWVFVSGRGRHRPGFKYRSRQPLSTDAFEQVWTGEMTYPQPKHVEGKGFLNLFTMYTGVRELYFESSADGRTWSKVRKLAGIREPGHQRGGHYQTSAAQGTKVGTFFNRHPNGDPDRRTDVYYLQTTDMGKTWTTIDGKEVAVPLTKVENPARVIDYASKRLNVYLKDMDFDADGRPVFLYVTSLGHQPGPPNSPRLWRVTRWTGSAWETHTITSSDHNYDMGSLYLSPERWLVIAPTEPGPQPHHGGGEMVWWESRDQGKTWSRILQATADSPRNHNYARRPLNARDPFYVFWADGDPTKLSVSRLYFADSTGKNVWRLPAKIEGETAKPEEVEAGER